MLGVGAGLPLSCIVAGESRQSVSHAGQQGSKERYNASQTRSGLADEVQDVLALLLDV